MAFASVTTAVIILLSASAGGQFPTVDRDEETLSAARGRELARRHRLRCHAVKQPSGTPGQVTGSPPSFATIARRYAVRPDMIKDVLISRHPPMPRFFLSDQEIEDVIAYIGEQ